MNFLKIPGLRTEDEFSKEYKELEQMIGNMEERSEAVNMNKKRDQESKKLEAFEVNKSLSNQIHSTNHELEDKILKSIAVIEDLEQTMETLRFNTARMISEYKRAVNSLATRKTEDLIDPKLKDQLFTAKNLFFKKVLREIVVDNDKNEEKIRILENKLMIKDKMLKKALLAAEHFKGSIELVERKYDRIKEKSATFLKRVNESLTFGSVKISDELGNIEIRKLLGHDFRSDKSIRESLNMKDTLLMVEADCFCIYESITSQDASSIINFSEIKEIVLLKDEGDSLLYTGMEVLDHNKMGYCFFIRYKNDRGGFIVEIETARVQKWDYIFLIVNLILSNNLPSGNIIKPLTLEATFSKIIKQLTFKTYENITLRKYAPFKFEYPIIEEKDTLENIEDRLLDWEVLEACSQREMSYIDKHNKMRQRDGMGTDTLSKATQTEPVLGQPGQMDSLNMNALGSKEKLIGKKNKEIDEFKYIVPTNKNYDNPEELYRSSLRLKTSLQPGPLRPRAIRQQPGCRGYPFA
jgi:hypothetical protein